jgi:hypothetical protein
MGLLVHFGTRRQPLFRQLRMMELAFIHGQVRDVILSADMIGLKAEGTNLSRRTYLLAGVAQNSLGRPSNHRAPPVLAYRFSTFNSPASAIRRIAAA